MDRAHAHYVSGNVRMSLSLYTKMATLGYSRAHANAAWIIEKELHKNDGRDSTVAFVAVKNAIVQATWGKLMKYIGMSTPNDDKLKSDGNGAEDADDEEGEGGGDLKQLVWCGGHSAKTCAACAMDLKDPSVSHGKKTNFSILIFYQDAQLHLYTRL